MKRMKAVLFSAVSILSASIITPAIANSTVTALLQPGAVLEITKPDGRVIKLTIQADNTYSTNGGVKGVWTIKQELFCMTRNASSNHDGRGGKKSCGQLPDGKAAGDNWVIVTDDGGNTKFSIVKTSK